MLSQRSIVNNLEIPFYKVVRAACYKEKNGFFFILLTYSVIQLLIGESYLLGLSYSKDK